MQLISEKNQWETKSKTDALTGLYNRRAIMDVLNRYQEAYSESEFLFSISIFDIDLAVAMVAKNLSSFSHLPLKKKHI